MVTMDARMLASIISTLKTLDVRGFESMDKLVGIVIALQNVLDASREVNEDGGN